ncbi:MAG TPA: asparagine synthase (glutamine-hydrolyzing) [Smithellaceae bacterium]|nr:asparagine synthase (glutamine-hydrolyzing) [Smithellaceae bacterium]
MCGISGILRFDPDSSELRPTVTAMTAMLAHRGPDEWGVYIGKNVALGHARLSIVDLKMGHQPMAADGLVISYNGEVYNYIELREELEQHGIVFTTRSDTEVVIRAYRFWGKDAFSRFNGQFAIILWDQNNRQMILARDRYGVRPLFVTRRRGAWYFASEMKAFDVLPGFRRTYNIQHLFEHGLLWNTVGSDTVYNNIRTVQPGTVETYRDGGPPAAYRFYSLGCMPQTPPASFEEARDELREMLRDAVRLRLRSDVPVGMYLSGGIDSSVLALLTSQVMGERFKSFSVTFGDSDFDESVYQKEMVSFIGSEHHAAHISYDTICDNFLQVVRHAERPLFRTAPVPLYLLSRLVRDNNIKVVITGEASDEILFGYDSYKELKLLRFWAKAPQSSVRPLLIKRLYPHLRHYADAKAYGLMKLYYEDFLDTITNPLAGLNIRIRNNTVLAAALNKDHLVKYNQDDLIDKITASFPSDYDRWTPLQQNQFLEMATLLDGYLLSSQGDRMSLGHGIEGRFPYLDYRLVERAFYWPDSYKLNGFSQKHILRSAFRGLIPNSIIDRPKLPYQAPDLRAFIRDGRPVPLVEEYLSPERIRHYGVFDERFVARFLNRFTQRSAHQVGYRDNMMLIFLLSAQIALHCAANPQRKSLDEKLLLVDLNEPDARH